MQKLLSIILMLFPTLIWSQPPCPPFSPCWCADHPMHPACRDIGIPISDWYGHMILIAGVTLLIYLQTRKSKLKTKNNEK